MSSRRGDAIAVAVTFLFIGLLVLALLSLWSCQTSRPAPAPEIIRVEVPVAVPCPLPPPIPEPLLLLPSLDLATADTNTILRTLAHDMLELLRWGYDQRLILQVYRDQVEAQDLTEQPGTAPP